MAKRVPPLAKLTAPSLPRVLPRLRLFRLLDCARTKKAVWILGPPGSGKTTLAVSYLRARKHKPFWYQLDEGDNDPATFFHYLGLAAQQDRPGKHAPLPHLTPEYLPGLPIFTQRFFEQLYQSLPSQAVLVFDNYHVLAKDSPVHEVIRLAASELPGEMRIIVLSRGELPIQQARLQTEQQLSVIDQAMLRLTKREAAQLIRLHTKRTAAPVVKSLYALTNGWMAGIVLLLQQRTNIEASVTTASTPEVLFNYLAREVLNEVDEPTRMVLLKTAIPPSMTVPMAEALSERPTAGAVLAHLYRIGYFTERRVEGQIRYQYHPLFKAFLLDQARSVFGQEGFIQLQEKTAALLAKNGQIEEAVALWTSTRRFDEAVKVILAHAPALLEQGRGQVVSAWITGLPEPVKDQIPWLLFWLGVVTLPLKPAHAQTLFERAFARFQTLGDQAGTLMAWAGVVDAIWYTWKDLPQMDRWIERFPALMPEGSRYPSPEIEAAVTCAMFNALFWRRPQYDTIMPWADKASEIIEHAPALTMQLGTTGVALVNLYVYVGELGKAERLLKSIEDALRRSPPLPFVQLALYQGEAALAVVLGDVSRCLETVSRGLALAKQCGVFLWNVPLMGAGCLAALQQGNLTAAQQHIDQMLAQSREGALFFRSWTLTLQGWVAMARGDLQQSKQAYETSLALTIREGPFPEAMSRLGMAQVLYAMDRHDEAAPHMARVQDIAREMRSPLLELSCRLAAAQRAFDQGDQKTGLAELRIGMGIGASTGIIEWQGKVRQADLAFLCAKALEAEIEPTYVRLLIRKRHLSPIGIGAQLESWPWPVKIYTLGRFALVRDEHTVAFAGKTQKRPLDLLKALISFGGRHVGQARVIEALWPEAEGDAAAASFNMALKRLRVLLGHPDGVLLTERKLTLNPERCWVDVWAFERGIAMKSHDEQEAGRVLSLYHGPFLGDEDAPWSLSMRERLRAAFLTHVQVVGERLEGQGNWISAADWYQRGLGVDDLIEQFYQRLMTCQQKLGRRAEALATYQRCKKTLQMYLGVAPSTTTEAIHRSVLA